MNIFATFPCPIRSAQYLDDKRVIKMILENAQMLSAAAHRHGVWRESLYKVAYQNHPCTLWVGDSISNVLWLYKHSIALNDIYMSNISFAEHKSMGVIREAVSLMIGHVHELGLTPFANCTPYKFEQSCVHELYKKFMEEKWANDARKPTWKGRENYGY
jgi:hypothetical protein